MLTFLGSHEMQKFIGGVVRKFEFVGPNTRCYDRTFLVGSASLDPTLVMPMIRPPRPDGGDAQICSLGEPDHILQVRCP